MDTIAGRLGHQVSARGSRPHLRQNTRASAPPRGAPPPLPTIGTAPQSPVATKPAMVGPPPAPSRERVYAARGDTATNRVIPSPKIFISTRSFLPLPSSTLATPSFP